MGIYNTSLNLGLYQVGSDILGRKISFIDPRNPGNRPIRFMVVDDEEGPRKIGRKGWFLPEFIGHTSRKNIDELRPVEVYEVGSVEDFISLMEDPRRYLAQLEQSKRLASFLGFKEKPEEYIERTEAQTDSAFDFLLLDIRMDKVTEEGKGRMDGLDAVVRISTERAREPPNPNFMGFPVVLLTAYGNQIDPSRSKTVSRADGIISKPVDKDRFKDAAIKFLDGKFIDPLTGRNYFTDRYKGK